LLLREVVLFIVRMQREAKGGFGVFRNNLVDHNSTIFWMCFRAPEAAAIVDCTGAEWALIPRIASDPGITSKLI
jgi:hypothetical protein